MVRKEFAFVPLRPLRETRRGRGTVGNKKEILWSATVNCS